MGGSFVLDGREHHLTPNEPPNHLHRGAVGFNKVDWELKSQSVNQAMFEHVSPSGRRLSGDTHCLSHIHYYRGVHIVFTAITDATTIVSLTNHTYFNLAGEGDILDHILCVPADQTSYLNGYLLSVAEKDTDFRVPTSMAGAPKFSLQDTQSGNELQVFSDQPGMQLYTGNFLDGSLVGRNDQPITRHSGVCLETQAWPNSINIKGAEDQVILRQYRRKTIWRLNWRK